MKIVEILSVLLVALIHFYFVYLEMFAWTHTSGMKAFGLKKDFAEKSKILAANQGLYNAFLAIGILWSYFTNNTAANYFFLICVVVAGTFGSISLKKKNVFYIQALPAIIALTILKSNSL